MSLNLNIHNKLGYWIVISRPLVLWLNDQTGEEAYD